MKRCCVLPSVIFIYIYIFEKFKGRGTGELLCLYFSFYVNKIGKSTSIQPILKSHST